MLETKQTFKLLKLPTMKSMFVVLIISIAGYKSSAQEIIDLSKVPTMELVSSDNITEYFMEKLRQKIPNKIQFPDQDSKEGPKFICSSTSFKLVDSFVRGLNDFTYKFDYHFGRPLPSGYSFKITLETDSSYKLSCSPWFKFQGPLNISLVNLQFDGTIKTTLMPPTIRFTTMTTHVDVVNVNINGVFNDATSAIISMILEDRATDLVNANQEVISNRLMKYINDMLEKILPGSADVERNENVGLDKYTDKNTGKASHIFRTALEEVLKLVESVFVQ